MYLCSFPSSAAVTKIPAEPDRASSTVLPNPLASTKKLTNGELVEKAILTPE